MPIGENRHGTKYLDGECRVLSPKLNSINALDCYIHEIKVDVPILQNKQLGALL